MSRFDSLDKTGVVHQNNKKGVPTIAKSLSVKACFEEDVVLDENQGCELVSS